MKALLPLFAICSLFASAEPLADVLARMDQNAAAFRSLSASMKRVQYTSVLNEKTEMDGAIRLRKGKAGTVGIVDFQQPEQRTIYVNGKMVEVYYPKANTVEIYDTSKYGVQNLDQFLLLGFGTTSAELRATYEVKGGPVETLSGLPSTRIDLMPTHPELQKLITKIELWIPQGQSTPIQEKITEPSKNYDLVTYSDIKVNPALAESAFEFKPPAGVKKIHPQK